MQYSLFPQGTRRRQIAAIFASLILVSGCINPSKNVYEAHDVGTMIDTTEATVLSSRIVSIKEETKGYGPLAGAAVGATGTGLASRGSRNAGWLIALGALAGAGIGLLTEQAGRSRDGIEYLVRTADGRTMTLVQNRGPSEVPIPAGKAVLVQHTGTYTRVVEKPETLEDQWRNPDAQSGSGTTGGSGTTSGGGGTNAGGAKGGNAQQPTGTPVDLGSSRRAQTGAPGPGSPANRTDSPATQGGGSTNGQDQ